MKNYSIPFFFILLLFTVTNAQYYAVDKGAVTVGGEISFASAGGDLNEVNGEKATLMLLNPSLGYFFMPNVCIGGELLYASTSQGDSKVTGLGGGPFAAFYIGDEYSRMYPFIGASLMLVSGQTENGEVTLEESQMDIKFCVGATMMAAKNVGLTGKVYYLMESYKPEGADESISGNQIGLSMGVSAFLW